MKYYSSFSRPFMKLKEEVLRTKSAYRIVDKAVERCFDLSRVPERVCCTMDRQVGKLSSR